MRDGLPTDLAKPLTVGQRVIAIHPRTREVHDGSVLTVDHDKCRIQFDRPEIGVEFVMVLVLFKLSLLLYAGKCFLILVLSFCIHFEL